MIRKSNPATLLAGQLVTAAASFGFNILASGTMSPNQRGQLALYLTVAYLLTALSLLAYDRPFLASQHGSFAKMLGNARWLVRPGIFLSAVPVALAVVAASFAQYELSVALIVIPFYIYGAVSSSVIRSASIASGTQAFLTNIFASQLSLLLFAGGMAFFKVENPNLWLCGYAVAGMVGILVMRLMSPPPIPPSPAEIENLRGVRARGLRLLPGTLGTFIMMRSDRLLLPLLSSATQLGLYATVATIMELATWPVNHWIDSSVRSWSRLSHFERTSTGIKLVFLAMLFLTGLTVAVAALAFLFVTLVLPRSYASSTTLIIPLGIAAIIFGMTRVVQGVLVSLTYSSRISVVEIIGSISCLIFYVALIPHWGALGAAWGSALGYGITLISGLLAMSVRRSPPNDQANQTEARDSR